MQPLSATSPGARNSHSTSNLTRGRTAYRQRRYAEAVRWFRVASREEPSDPWNWIWLARTLKQLDDRDGSYASIRRALGIAPDAAPARLHLIDLLLEEGRNDLADDALKDLAGGSGREEWVARAVTRRLARLPDPHAVLSQLPPSPRILHIRDRLRAEVRVTSGSWSPRASERQDLELRLAEIMELALRVRPSAILASRGRWTGLPAMHARKLLGTSMIYEAGPAPAPYASSQVCRWRRDQEQRLLEAADLILVRTVAARDRYLQAGIGRGRIAVVPAREAYGVPPASGRATWPSRFMASSSWASAT
ncbi:MAG: glycosyltransferase [Gemmatimonadota bacterium]